MSNAIKIESETVKAIRAQFPKPKKAGGNKSGNNEPYCVLGAVYRYARLYLPDLLTCIAYREKGKHETMATFLDRHVDNFPGGSQAAKLLKRLNCSLDDSKAITFAHDVMSLNDHGKFGQAWGKLSEALLYKPVDDKTCV